MILLMFPLKKEMQYFVNYLKKKGYSLEEKVIESGPCIEILELNIIIGFSGLGKVEMALRTQSILLCMKLIYKREFRGAICLGSAGCLSPKSVTLSVTLGDVLIADTIIEYDFEQKVFQGPQGPNPSSLTSKSISSTNLLSCIDFKDPISKVKNSEDSLKILYPTFPISGFLYEDLKNNFQMIEENHDYDPSSKIGNHSNLPFQIHFGRLASGDRDVIDRVERDKILNRTQALGVTWESAGFARACRRSKVPFAELRSITDYCEFKTEEGNDFSSFFIQLEMGMSHLAQILEPLLVKWRH